MNAMVATQLKQIAVYVGKLRKELERTNKQTDTLTKARDDLQKQSWAKDKKLAVFKEGIEDLVELRNENEELNEQNDEFEQRLRRILTYVRALAVEYHP